MGNYIPMQSGLQKNLNNPVNQNSPQTQNTGNQVDNSQKLKDAQQPNKISEKDKAIIAFIRANAVKFPILIPMLNNPIQRKIATNIIKSFLDPNNTNLLNSLKVQLTKIKE